jgi:hypothetical protein
MVFAGFNFLEKNSMCVAEVFTERLRTAPGRGCARYVAETF